MVFQNIFRFFQKILSHKGFCKIGGSLRKVWLMEFDTLAIVFEEISGDVENTVAHGLDAFREILFGDILLAWSLFETEDGGLFAGLRFRLLSGQRND